MSKARLIGSAVVSLALASTAAFAQTTDLTFWSWRPEDRAAYEQIIADFEKKNPTINVTFVPFEPTGYPTVLSTALAGGKGPDVMMVRAYGGLEQLSKAGYLEPITGKFPELANFTPQALAAETMRSDKQLYAVPFATQTLGLYYNKAVFQKNNIAPPRTWADLMSAGQKLKAAGVIPLANGTKDAWQAEIMLGVFGPNVYGASFYNDLKAGKADFEDPRFIAAIRKLQELVPLFPPNFTAIDYTTAQQLFTSERAAMFAGGSFEMANFRNQNKNLQMDFIPAPSLQPGGPRLVSMYVDGGYAVNAKSPNKAAALKFLQFLASPEFGQKFTDLLQNISPIKGVVPKDATMRQVVEYNKNSLPYVMYVDFRYDNPTGSALLQPALQKVLAGTLSAEQAAKEVMQGMSGYFKPVKR